MELLTSSFSLPSNSVFLFIATAVSTWLCLREKLNYWKNRGVPHVSALACLCDFIFQLLRIKRFSTSVSQKYKLLEGHSYAGIYQFLRPAIILRDPTMVKEWVVKGFSHFHDRNSPPDEQAKNLSGNLLSLTGDRWHAVRSKVSPAFSPVKLKVMYETLKSCSDEVAGYLKRLCADRIEVELDVDDFMSRYAMDITGAWGLGIECNAIKDPQNCEMKQVVDQFMRANWRHSVELFLSMIHPKLASKFRSMCHSRISNFITSMTKQTMDIRHKDGSSRKDFIQILINVCNAEKEKERDREEKILNGELQSSKDEDSVFTENIVAGTIVNMLGAGLHPVAATATFCLYELAYHPEIQDRIFEEIQAVKSESGDGIGFEDLKKLDYLKQVIQETLRKHPPGGLLTRKCTEPFKIPDSSIVIEKGVDLLIPVMGFHHDSKYFPEPDNFDPERFSKENIDKIVPGSYLPFGEGPRFCIAYRMALMNVKSMLITILSDYTFHPCARTRTCVKYDRKTFTLSPDGEVWLRIKKRICR